MRTIIPAYEGGDRGESRGLRSRMKKLLWLRASPCAATEPGVWLTGFQALDNDDGRYEVRQNETTPRDLFFGRSSL